MPRDDKQIFAIRRDISGGMNNRQHGANIGETQMTLLKNIDIGVKGEALKRPGISSIEDLGNDPGYGLFGFEPAEGTNELLAIHGTSLEGYIGSGSFTAHKTNFTGGTISKIIKTSDSTAAGDIALVKIDGNNWFSMNQSHAFTDLGTTSGTGNDSPPDSAVATVFGNRVWILKGDLLYWSDVYPTDYTQAFDTASGNYRMPVGEERALVGIRDLGIIAFGEDEVWAINPSVIPAATDKPEKILDIGCIANNTVVQVFDDIMFLARDGVRGLFRTQQDKVQAGTSFPLSFALKDEYESINWAQIEKATAVFYDNKYMLSLPVDSSSTNNEVWVYYPAFQAWVIISGWNVGAWAKVRFDGEEKLYAIDSTDGNVYEAWSGFDDNGSAIDYDEQGRKEDFGQPLITKSGGEIKVKAFSSGAYDLTIQVSVDDQDWVTLGTMSLAGNAPTLPAVLPFNLADDNLITESFHLDSLGPFNQIRLRIRHNAANGSDDIKVFERQIITFADEYQSE